MPLPVIGVIGCGGISRFHFAAIKAAGATIAAVSDIKAEAAAARAAEFGCRASEDWRSVVADPRVGLIHCCAPSPLHAEISRAALQAGKHVVCEKTLTLDPADSLELAKLARAGGRRLFVNYMKRFFPAVRKAQELLPRLGRIASLHVRTHQNGPCDFFGGDSHPFFTPGADGRSGIVKMSGGGVLTCAGSHMLDLMILLAGKPSSVYGRRWLEPGHDADKMFHGLMDLPGGAVAHLDCTWHFHNRVGFEGRGWDESIEIIGGKGRMILRFPVWDNPERAAARLSWYDESTQAWTEFGFDSANAFVEAGKHFIAQVAAGAQGPMDEFTGYRVDAVIAALWKSSATSQPVAIDWQDQQQAAKAS